jgi:hypothetical protein
MQHMMLFVGVCVQAYDLGSRALSGPLNTPETPSGLQLQASSGKLSTVQSLKQPCIKTQHVISNSDSSKEL